MSVEIINEDLTIFHGVQVPRYKVMTDQIYQLLQNGAYENHEVAGVLKVVRPGDRVLEVGAGVGVVGAIAVKTAGAAQMVSFEANPDLIPHIRALYELNGIADSIETRNEILMTRPKPPKTVTFSVETDYLASRLGATDTAARKVKVPTASYSKLREGFAPDVIIMDIEGAEAEFLEHADLSGVRAIVIEFHPAIYGLDVMRTYKRKLGALGFQRLEDVSTRLIWACERTL